MELFGGCDIGFEDGQILGHRSEGNRLIVDYVFWNEKRAEFSFVDWLGLQDVGAVKTMIGRAVEMDTSSFLITVFNRIYSDSSGMNATAFQFLDLDDNVALEVVASSCHYALKAS